MTDSTGQAITCPVFLHCRGHLYDETVYQQYHVFGEEAYSTERSYGVDFIFPQIKIEAICLN